MSPRTKALIKQPHYWLICIAGTISAILATHILPHDSVQEQTLIGISSLLWFFGYRAGVRWTPPRVIWSNEERIARGLAPLPPKIAPEEIKVQLDRIELLLTHSAEFKGQVSIPPFDTGEKF